MTVPVPAGRTHVAAHAGITFVGLMTANVLAFVFNKLVSRVIGVEAYGTFSSLVAIVLILSAPALIGQLVVAKLASDWNSDPDRLAGLVRAVDRATLTCAVVAGLVLAASSVPLAGFLRVRDPLLVTLAGLSLGGALALPFLRGILQGTSRFHAYALSNVAEAGGKALFAPAFGLIAGVRGAVAGMALGYAIAAVATFFATLPHRRGISIPFSLRTVARTSAAIALAVFCVNVLLLYDSVLAKHYLDPHTAGLYNAVALAGRSLYALVSFVPIVLLPHSALRAARRERTRWLLLQALGLSAAIGAAAVGFFALLPNFVIVTFTSGAFSGGVPFLVPYVYSIAALSLANVVVTYNISRGRMGFIGPLALVAVGEMASVVLRHRSAADLLQTIVVGHTFALLAAATSLGGSRRPRPGAESEIT